MTGQECDQKDIWAIILRCKQKKRRPKLLQETKHVIGGSVASKTYGVIFPFSLVNIQLEAVNFKSDFY